MPSFCLCSICSVYNILWESNAGPVDWHVMYDPWSFILSEELLFNYNIWWFVTDSSHGHFLYIQLYRLSYIVLVSCDSKFCFCSSKVLNLLTGEGKLPKNPDMHNIVFSECFVMSGQKKVTVIPFHVPLDWNNKPWY